MKMSVKNRCVMLLEVVALHMMLSRCLVLGEIPKCQDVNTTAESCCPCFQDIDTCNQTCPENYLSVNKTADSVNCETNLTRTTTTTIATTTIATTTNGSTEIEYSTVETSNQDFVLICLKSCQENQFYSSEEQKCLDCDKKCLKCRWEGKNCSVCMYKYNETCFAQCPEGTVESKNNNGSKLCEEKKETQDKSSSLPFIIGGAVGGGVVAIIVVVVIVCCCCCRNRETQHVGRRTKESRMAMSVLLENQQTRDESRKEETSRPAGSQRPNYENTCQTLPSNREIQQQGDNVLRYTKDPTLKSKSSKNLQEENEESPYGNAAMIRLAQNVDVGKKKEDELKEMLDVEEMGEAPVAPVVSQHKTPLPVSTKTTKRTGKPIPEQPEHIPEDYVDMSGGTGTITVNTGSAASADVGGDLDASSSLQDYENFNFDKIQQGRRAEKVKTSPEDDLEVYENAGGDKVDKGKGDNSDLEDYENTKGLRKKPSESKKRRTEEADNMENYEDMNELELYENVPGKSN